MIISLNGSSWVWSIGHIKFWRGVQKLLGRAEGYYFLRKALRYPEGR